MKWLRENWIPSSILTLLALALIASALLGGQHPPSQNVGSQGGEYKQQETIKQDLSERDLRSQILSNQPLADKKPERKEWREERDLIAQTDMAYWAKLMFWASAVMAFISWVGVVLIFETLKATRQAVDVTRDIGIAQSKAYLRIKASAKLAVVQEDEPLTMRPTIWFEIFNTGNTPAYNLKIVCNTIFSNDTSFEPFNTSGTPFEKNVSGHLANDKENPAIRHVYVAGGNISHRNDVIFVEGVEEYIVAQGYIEFDDIFTIDKNEVRRLYFHRSCRTFQLADRVENIQTNTANMTANHENEREEYVNT